MQSTDSHGPKRAILYARVSTDEQARSGYSLAQQLEALREYAVREGYEVLEEIIDPGQSGASLARPGMDRVRDLVAAGDVSVVLAQDRDRFAREPAYHRLLRQEFEEQGCRLKAMNDRGDDSPEGELTDGILDQLAKFERAKVAERTRRGKLRKAKEGKIIADGHRPTYGFTYNEPCDGYTIDEVEMAVVHRIFEMVAAGMPVRSVKKELEAEMIPAPRGGKTWYTRTIHDIVLNDCYLPYSTEELSQLISSEVVARLDPERLYGISWYGKRRASVKQVAEHDAEGKRRYRSKQKNIPKPREEWIGVPVPAGQVPRQLVETARQVIADNPPPSRAGNGKRFWELSGGVMLCSECGRRMTPDRRKGKDPATFYNYYRCNTHRDRGPGACPNRKLRRAEKTEAHVWAFVSSLLQNPEQLRLGLERLIEEEKKSALHGDFEREAKAMLRSIEESNRQRAKAQELAIEDLLSHEELRSKLHEIEERRQTAQKKLAALSRSKQRVEELERDAETLLSSYAMTVPKALESLSSEERQQVYKMLRLKVHADADGTTTVTGALASEEFLCTKESTPRSTPTPSTRSDF